jgi:hypothetical protein
MDITGRLIQILAKQTGQGKNGTWQKQDFVIETNDQYPKKVCLSAWADKVDELAGCREGETLKVFFDVQSREYNGKWYTDLRAWKIQKGGGDQSGGGSNRREGVDPVRQEPGIDVDTNWEGDLPF